MRAIKPSYGSYTVVLPLPPVESSSNFTARSVRRRIGASRARAAYRADCAMAYRCAKIPPLPTPVTITLEYWNGGSGVHDKRLRPRDEGNGIAAAKQAVDALIDAGIIPDDSHPYLTHGRCTIHSTMDSHKNRAALVLTITPAPPSTPVQPKK